MSRPASFVSKQRSGGCEMGKMTDGTDCLICEQQKDCDSPEQLILCCRECQSEVAFLLAENKYDFYFRRDV